MPQAIDYTAALPVELLDIVLHACGFADARACLSVDKRWRERALRDDVWNRLAVDRWGSSPDVRRRRSERPHFSSRGRFTRRFRDSKSVGRRLSRRRRGDRADASADAGLRRETRGRGAAAEGGQVAAPPRRVDRSRRRRGRWTGRDAGRGGATLSGFAARYEDEGDATVFFSVVQRYAARADGGIDVDVVAECALAPGDYPAWWRKVAKATALRALRAPPGTTVTI